ncbi:MULTISPECIES: DUF4190 domain-containing protein [Bacillaceae]|uniref:DUF4190 domain-containing protein n=1 Tax=Bacillaceae TaxID=186817 RepID=UPI000685A102|nr:MULTISPECIES: DUF4190 domain-containing protein [Bacillaceae]UOE96199.1 DUF4190 domain-containing protein [Alkalihalobacillus sp. LMS39]
MTEYGEQSVEQVDSNKHSGKAIASLVLGLVAIIFWLIPLFGIPITIVGLVLGIIARKSNKRGMAIAGIILSSIFLLLSLINAVLGAILVLSGF